MRRAGLLLPLLVCMLGSMFVTREASALPEPAGPMGARGQLAIDQISGFRARTDGSISYYGPVGFSINSFTATNLDGSGDTTYHNTSFWLAPSADYFVIDNLSVGGLFEFSSTSTSADFKDRFGVVNTISLPSQTSFTLLPRVGYLIPLGNRFGIWPRGGIGYVSRQQLVPDNNIRAEFNDTFHAILLDVDVGFLFRLTDSFFIKAAPDMAFSFGGSHSETPPTTNITRTADANVFQFALVTGIGGMFDL